jgi:hypothetical protein
MAKRNLSSPLLLLPSFWAKLIAGGQRAEKRNINIGNKKEPGDYRLINKPIPEH